MDELLKTLRGCAEKRKIQSSSDARAVAVQYFAQGHEVGFLRVKPWLTNLLGTIGTRCRSLFTSEFLHLLDSPEVPAILKVAWNDLVKKLLS